MTFYKKTVLFFCLLLCFSFKAVKKNTFFIHFNHYAGNAPFSLGNTYHNALGQPFTVSNFKYYISNVRLQKNDGTFFSCTESFLIDEREEESKRINIHNVPDGTYTAVEFIIGVDSAHNCNGLQAGALDPVNGMFWAWNTGYIFMKIEGLYFSNTNQQKKIEYHIGGYKAPNNSIRKVHLDFKGARAALYSGSAAVFLKADVLQIFTQPKNIDFLLMPSVTELHNATLVADNYADMFSYLDIKNNP
ncbi:MAG: hypothetical protein JST67_07540 [Bacteroidetes bacterium]|nr:hypothetical protein [Bacteroidota bacterium]